MKQINLNIYKKRFKDYVKEFYSDNQKIHANIILKEKHTLQVCERAKEISDFLNLSQKDRDLAYLTALFHDIGRFEQFTKYKTFADKDSVNHGTLGLEILKQENMLENLTDEYKGIITTAIKYHNCMEISPEIKEKKLLHAKIIRDADKLDIFRVLTEYYKDPVANHNQALEKPLTKIEVISEDIFNKFMNKEKIYYKEIKTLSDMKILRLGWIYDLNYEYSIEYVKDKGYLELIYNSLPSLVHKDEVGERLKEIYITN